MPAIALFIAFVSGISMAVQGSINAALGKIVGVLEATLVVHIVGTVIITLFLFIFKLEKGNLGNLPHVPWYLYLGGLLGVIIVYGVVTSIPPLGVAIATTAIIVGQVGTALVIDHFGLFGLERIPFSWLKAVGVGLLAMGTKFMLMK